MAKGGYPVSVLTEQKGIGNNAYSKDGGMVDVTMVKGGVLPVDGDGVMYIKFDDKREYVLEVSTN